MRARDFPAPPLLWERPACRRRRSAWERLSQNPQLDYRVRTKASARNRMPVARRRSCFVLRWSVDIESVRLDPELRQALADRAERDQQTTSAVIREALRRYLDVA